MQGKGVVKFFLVVMTLVTLVQYMFILPTNRVERDAAGYAESKTATIADPVKRQIAQTNAYSAYLDSMSSEKVFSIPLIKQYTYQELKNQQLALGLDLKGGMSVVLQVDVKEFVDLLSKRSQDPTFRKALDMAGQNQGNTQTDFLTLFEQAWVQVRGDKRLAPIFLKNNESLRGSNDYSYDMSDAVFFRKLREKSQQTVGLTHDLLKQRIDKLGVVQPNVTLDQERDLIIVELPGISNPQRAREFLQAAANLEFYDVYRASEPAVANGLTQANTLLTTLYGSSNAERTISRIDTVYQTDSLGNQTGEIARFDTTYNDASQNGPLFDLMTPTNAATAMVGVVERNKRDTLQRLLAREDIKAFFPADLSFHFDRETFTQEDETLGDSKEMYRLYAIQIPRDGEAPLTGENIRSATAQLNPVTKKIGVSLSMDQNGAKIWADMTTKAAQNNQREIAILLDGEVVSAPSVNEPITGGSSEISGGFNMQQATDLASILEVGKLPATTKIIQESVVGPSLGKDNIRRSFIAMGIGYAILFAFMVFYYGTGGIVSIIALLLNVVFIFGTLASYGTVLTLPGIAGIVLTIGMAVDINVIIYERIREELRSGKTLMAAVTDGFKHSYSAIIDANVTTLLTAIVLAYFGLGPIKGFAVVLIIGILSSLFTAMLVSRLIIDWWLNRGKTLTFETGVSKSMLSNVNVDWMGKRKMAYTISGLLILASLASFFTKGFDLGVDFRGGYSYNVSFANETVTADQLRTGLTEAFGKAPVVKVVDTDNTFNIVTDYLINETAVEGQPKPEDRVLEALYNGVKGVVGGDLNQEDFNNPDGIGTHVSSFNKVGPTIAGDITRSAFYAAIISLLLIFGYIFIRFSKWQYSLGAVAALFHDTIITMGVFSIFAGILPFSLEIDQTFIAAILTVIGYSMNDTVIVFDRLREYLNTYTKSDKTQVFNDAINSTLSRTLITSLTTIFVVLVLFLFGGASIRGFAFALLVGITVGTYSSIFIASPIVHDLTDDNVSSKPATPSTDKAKAAAGAAS